MVINGRKPSQHSAMQSTRRLSDYRENDIPAELYDTSNSRLSDASLFGGGAHPSGDTEPRAAFPWRTALVSLVLFVIGLVFLLVGLLHFRDKKDREATIAFVVVGSISFLPGCYAAYNIIQWYRGVPGFHISQFAHWDDFRW